MNRGTEKFRHVLGSFYGQPWLIHPAKFAEIELALLARVKSGQGLTPAEFIHGEQNGSSPRAVFSLPSLLSGVQAKVSDTGKGYDLAGGSAVISIDGAITARPTLFQEFSGGTSHETIASATQAALADDEVENIVYVIDSPGGAAAGMPEAADIVAGAKKTKPTYGIAAHTAASAAYWYLSQTAEASVTPAGQVGCIGCIVGNMDQTKMLDAMGVRSDLIANDTSPFKTEGYPQVSVTPEWLAELKRIANHYGTMFEEAIAKGRGIRVSTVQRDFGRGRMLLAQEALAARMVDKVEPAADTVNRVNGVKGRKARREVTAKMAARGLPLA